MSLGKKILIGVVGFFAAIALLVFIIFQITGPLVEVADSFLGDLARGDVTAAYGKTSSQFRNGTDQARLLRFAEDLSLDRMTETSWGSRSMEASSSGPPGRVEGTVTLDDGTEHPLSINFVKEDDAWRIHSIESPSLGFGKAGLDGAGPGEAELVELVHETIVIFANAVAVKSMETLHQHSAMAFKAQFTVAQLDEIYAPFLPMGNNLMVLRDLSPAFNAPPSLDDNGWLDVKGSYSVGPDQVDFEITYIFEGLSWKMGGLNVNIPAR